MDDSPSKIVSAQKEIIVIAPVGPIRVSVVLVSKVLQPLRVQGVLPSASSAGFIIVVVPVNIVVLILVHLFVPCRAVTGRVAVILRTGGIRTGAMGMNGAKIITKYSGLNITLDPDRI